MTEDLLSQLANKYASDKGTISPSTGHHGPRLHFTTIYHKYLDSIREKELNFLEIGIGSGPSLKMWYDYFPNSKIHAIDIVPNKQHENEKVTTYIANQQNRDSLKSVMEQIGPVDVIIDDGGHMMGQQQVSFGYLFKYLKSGGLYFIEDLHTSYWPFGKYKDLYGFPLDINLDRSNTTVKMIEDFIKDKKITSHFLNEEEISYLNDNINTCDLFNLPPSEYGPNQLALFTKK